ncbi:MAG: hypothetical protein KUG65_05635 [Sphingomonadaceae bacterium]|nr:hypothetical protein [Sphingomonadaceae bacterium]
MKRFGAAPAYVALVLVAACQPGGRAEVPGDTSDRQPFAEISSGEVLHFTGTEPFWGGETRGDHLTYSTPENIDGARIAVVRFAGRGGLSLGGKLDGASFDMMVTPGECSDGMSDRTYPFVVTLKIGKETKQGCGWTQSNGYSEVISN